jgi:streptomycin 6-kinase
MGSLPIPPELTRNVLENWAGEGRRWLAELPSLVTGVAADWELSVGASYELSHHWVAPVIRADGSRAVLKLGVPSGHLAVEAEALRVYGGHGAVRLLAEDAARGALLLERAEPGTPAAALVPHDDTAATAALIDVGRRLHRPVPSGCRLPDLSEERESFHRHLARFRHDDPLPRRLVVRAAGLFDELCASAPERHVLHGDLHHDNVLDFGAARGWLAIDPKGLVGERGFEFACLFCNPDPALATDPARLAHRAAVVAEAAGLARGRLLHWVLAYAGLSAAWSLEDGEPPDVALRVAELAAQALVSA